MPLFVEEIDVVREFLGLDRVHVLGQWWLGMLAMEYALTQSPGLVGLTIASSPASMVQWVAEANRLRAARPPLLDQHSLLVIVRIGSYRRPHALIASAAPREEPEKCNAVLDRCLSRVEQMRDRGRI